MADAVYLQVTGGRPDFIEVTTGDKPTVGIRTGAHYRDLDGVDWVWNSAIWFPIAVASIGPVTIGTVDQGLPGIAGPWPVVLGAAHEVLAYNQSKTNSILDVIADGPCKVEYVVINWDGAVTETALLTILAGLGSDWDGVLDSVVFTSAQQAMWFPPSELHIVTGDSLQVEAPAVVDQISSIAIYGQAE